MKKNNNEKGQNNCQKLFLKLIHLIAQYIYIYIYTANSTLAVLWRCINLRH